MCKIAVAAWSTVLLIGTSTPARTEMTLEEARAILRSAYDAYKQGNYARAADLARSVLAQRGNVYVRWPGPDAKHPAPDVDIYDDRAFIRAQMIAAQATGQEVLISVRGASARGVLLKALYKMQDWEGTARLAEEILKEVPDASVAWSMLKIARAKMAQAGEMGALSPAVMVGQTYFTGEVRNINNRLLVTGTHLGRLLGAEATWNAKQRQLEVACKGQRLLLSSGATIATLNGERITIPVAPILTGGQLLVPLRFVAETFGRQVVWEGPPRIAWVR